MNRKGRPKKPSVPPDWGEKRVKQLIAHYDSQNEDEEFADIEAARETEDITLMAIPTEPVPKVRALLAGVIDSRFRLRALGGQCGKPGLLRARTKTG